MIQISKKNFKELKTGHWMKLKMKNSNLRNGLQSTNIWLKVNTYNRLLVCTTHQHNNTTKNKTITTSNCSIATFDDFIFSHFLSYQNLISIKIYYKPF